MYEYRTLPLAASLDPEWIWRADGTLAYRYLLHASDDTLLVLGDDGGFSGMHYFSNLAGIDLASGELRWQLDTGYAGIDAAPSEDGEHVTVLTRIDRETGEHVNRLRHVRMQDGETLWEAVLPERREFTALSSVHGAVIAYSQPFQDESEGHLEVRDAASGKLRWERSFKQPFAVLNESSRDPYVYLLQVDTLEALDPKNGKPVWSLRGLGMTDPDPYASPFLAPRADPFDAEEPVRWLELGAHRMLVDLRDGTVLAKQPIAAGVYTEAIDNRHWLIQKPLDDDRYWMASEFETVLYDAIDGKIQWRLPGRAGGAVADEDTLFVTYNGMPAAIDRQSGRIRWQTPGTGKQQPDWQAPGMLIALQDGPLLVAAGPDVFALDPLDGRVSYRVQDALIGYPETHGEWMRSHLAVQAPDGSLYLGSANGRFSRLRLPLP